MNRHLTLACFSALVLTGCATSKTPEQPIYGGTGGMTEWNIQPQAYLFHYENGFSGIDALGYDEMLQKIWSRLGAAKTCRVSFNKAIIISQLVKRYGESSITHELNGIGFHSVQSRKVPGFCNDERVKDISKSIDRYIQGYFS